jgi:hypothetical protein
VRFVEGVSLPSLRSLFYCTPRPAPSLARCSQYTVLAAAHACVEVRVVESMCRATEAMVELRGDAAVVSLCDGKVVAGLISLNQVIEVRENESATDLSCACVMRHSNIESCLFRAQTETAKARVAAARGGSYGGGSSGDGATLPLSDLARCETAIMTALRSITVRVRTALAADRKGPLGLKLADTPGALTDLLSASAGEK